MAPSTERAKRWRKNHPEYFQTEKFKLSRLNASLKYKYGITLEQKHQLFEKQNGICPICILPLPNVLSDGCCVDHDHETNVVRSLLHKGCNVWVGFIEKHGKQVLERIKTYL